MLFKLNYILNLLNKKKYDSKSNTLIMEYKNTYVYQLELIFKLSSALSNKNKFIIMSILIEKYLSNKLIFLLDKKTLSSNKFIKVGYINHVQSDKLYTLLELCALYNVPKFYNLDLIFDFSKSYFMKYENKKLLSNFVFHLDKDISYYYSYLNEFEYHLSFLFKSNFNYQFFNKLLLNLYNYNFILQGDILLNDILNVSLNVLLTESDSDEELIDDEKITSENDIVEENKNYIIDKFNSFEYLFFIKDKIRTIIVSLLKKKYNNYNLNINTQHFKNEFSDSNIDLILFDEIFSEEIIFDYYLFLDNM